jgi:two-component system, OmpR family, phosphate regulon sensor histidine kinase PhoR
LNKFTTFVAMIRTPKQFALFLAFILSIIAGVIDVILELIMREDVNLLILIFTVLITGVLGYFIIYYFLEKLITQKIRTLYRTIHSFKISKGDFPVNMNEDVLAKSEREVLDWVKGNKDEITKLKEQETFRREFIGNLAHELRTPVFSVQGYILTLLEGGLEDEEINRKFLKRAADGIDRMTGILEDLDTITRLESDRLNLKMKKVDIVSFANEIIESFEFKAKEKNIKISFEKKPTEALYVNCDRDKIGQVLTNLINNALNYGNENGYVKIRFFDYEDNILVEVSDNGIGIAKENLARVFERFYRVDKSRSRHEGGTGLGLAIVKHIVESHGQLINVRSTVGEGSTFSFTLEKYKS